MFDGFLTLYQEGRDDDGEDEENRRLPAIERGRNARQARSIGRRSISPSRRRATRKRPWSSAGRARHRPALDLCVDPPGAARPRLCAHGQEPLRAGGQGPHRHGVPESFFTRYVEYDFTADLEEKLDLVSDGELAWKRPAARLLERVHPAPSTDIKDLRITDVLDALDEMLGPHIFPPREDGSDPRAARPAATAGCR